MISLSLPTFLNFKVLVAEAERLWARFQQLGPNDEQTLPNEAFQQHLFTSDPFARQVTIFITYFMIV